MKLLPLLLLLSISCFAQSRTYRLADTNVRIDSTTGGMIYTEVVPVPMATTEQLYGRAKSFLLRVFTNESAVTQIDDKDNGVVGARGKFMLNNNFKQSLLTGQLNMYYEMAVEIRVKDGRYKYEFSNIEIVNRGQRVRIDDAIRKNPKLAAKSMNREYSQKEYDSYMNDKNPIQAIVKQLKQTMNPPKDKNDF